MYLTFVLSYFILATFYLKTSWGALTNYDMQRESELKDHFREKLATHLSATTKEVWGVELYPGKPRRDNNVVNRGSYMSAHVLLNLLNELGKRD